LPGQSSPDGKASALPSLKVSNPLDQNPGKLLILSRLALFMGE